MTARISTFHSWLPRISLFHRSRAAEGATAVPHLSWGWLPAISLIQAVGLLSIAWANALSRADQPSAEYFLWAGLLIIVLPVTLRMLSNQMAHRERVGLIVLLALSLYLVKVFHSPLAFTFADELIHLYNVEALRESHRLFTPNTLLPVTPLYPGLHVATAALADFSGLSSFAAGLVLVGAARIMFLLAFYLALRIVSRSVREAGLATILYTTNTNFVYWSAQFAYESLALPLASVVALAVVARAASQSESTRAGFSLAAFPLILAIVVTHHLTSYALVALLVLFAIGSFLFYRYRQAAPWHLAAVALVATAAWFHLVASSTLDYLSPVVLEAFRSVTDLLTQQGQIRQFFSASGRSASSFVTPLWEKVIAFGSVILLTLGMLRALLVVWRVYRQNIFAVSLTLLALSYFPIQVLRLTSAGWETSNRASEFLFAGLGFAIAAGLILFHGKYPLKPTYKAVVLGYVAVVFLGGIMAGWPRPLRLGLPYTVNAAGVTIEPPGVAAARWADEHLTPNNVIAGDETNARLLLAYAGQQAYTGERFGVQDLLYARQIGRGEREILAVLDADYVVFDRRHISWDNMRGIYFEHHTDRVPPAERYLPPEAEEKFNREPNVDRLFDSGQVVIFDVDEVKGNRHD